MLTQSFFLPLKWYRYTSGCMLSSEVMKAITESRSHGSRSRSHRYIICVTEMSIQPSCNVRCHCPPFVMLSALAHTCTREASRHSTIEATASAAGVRCSCGRDLTKEFAEVVVL